jgi:hypothetical protein
VTGLPSALRRGPLSGRDPASWGASPLGDAAAAVFVALAGAAAAWTAFTIAPRVVFQLGPNDSEYTRGFRPGRWERDGTTRFHWTTMSSLIQLPVRVEGEGFVLRARVRRHMTEPAQVQMRVEGRVVESFSVVGGGEIAYNIVEIRIPGMEGRHPFVLGIESSSADTRPLGVAIDWVELVRAGPGRFHALPALAAWLALLAAMAYVVPRLGGASRSASLAHALALVVVAAVAGAFDVIALDRIVRDGLAGYASTAGAALLIVALLRRAGVEAHVSGLLAILVLVAIALRLALLLHPRFYYPDMANHATVAYVLSREGAGTFLSHYSEKQFRFSLGLQEQAGHVYAFPYAPGLYFLCAPLIAIAKLRPEVAVATVASVFNSLGLVVTFVAARFLLRSDRVALLASLAHLALPLYLIRLTMAYFPSVTGHAIDAAALAFLLVHLTAPPRLRTWLILGALLTLSLLLYPQAIVNFALLFGAYLAWDFVKAPDRRRQQVALALTATLALAAAGGLFYHRYVPVFLDMRHGRPMAEEQHLLDYRRTERAYAESRGETIVPHVEIDPYSGPSPNPVRGLWRVIARLFIFHGPFLLTVLWGLYLMVRAREDTERRFLAVWASLFFVVCFLAGAMPGPNFLRYSKDLEASAPLFCAAFALATAVIARRSRALAIVHVAGFVLMGIARGVDMWLSTFEPR